MTGTDQARRLLQRAQRIVVLTGAGISADSGLATFRGEEGLWEKHRPEDLATPGAFARDARLVWSWYDARRRAVADALPNEAHLALARLARHRNGVTIATQNVDGLHTLAAERLARDGGKAPPTGRGEEAGDAGGSRGAVDELLELHGCLFRIRCGRCGWRTESRKPIDTSSDETLPHCPDCDALARPDVVWFGEPLGRALEVAFERAAMAEACLVVGTSGRVQPAASIAAVTARGGGAVVEVNPEPSALTPLAEVSIRARAAEAVPDLVDDTRRRELPRRLSPSP